MDGGWIDELGLMMVDIQRLLLIPIHLVVIQRVVGAVERLGKVGPDLWPDQARLGAWQAAGGDDVPWKK